LGDLFKQLLKSVGDKRKQPRPLGTTFISHAEELGISEKMKCVKCGREIGSNNREDALCKECKAFYKKRNYEADHKMTKYYLFVIWWTIVLLAIGIGLNVK